MTEQKPITFQQADYPAHDVQVTSVMADVKQPFLKMVTRWDYASRFIKIWKKVIQFRFYSIISAVIGFYFIPIAPMVSALAFGLAVYLYFTFQWNKKRLEAQRTVMIGH